MFHDFFLSGLFLPLNVLLAVCRLEGGHDTSILLFNQRVKLYCLTMIIFCKIFSLLFLTYSNLLIFILSYFLLELFLIKASLDFRECSHCSIYKIQSAYRQ